ncbi:MAG: molecular chaperone DnaJ [Bacilli bacterium]|jgi:molecular chaperone DnaJ|nr:molecular chaperone DnaJ [Bacilli bacterium]
MAEKRDLYEVLGIKKTATKDEIKSAYRKLAKKYHPDNKETGNEAKFKEVQEAYDILFDDNKKATYDQFGHAAFDQAGRNPGANPFSGGFSGNPFGDEGIDLGDIFSSFFGGGSQRSTRQSGPRRGSDVIMRVKVDFMDSITGRDITVPYTYDATCPTCGGTGAKSASHVHTCSNCGGKGYVKAQKRTLFGAVETQETCPVCNGTGKTISEKCPTCNGNTYVRTKIDLKVHVPAGISSGQQIRVSGKGGRGHNGGPSGDLFIEVIVKPDSKFQRNGNDISMELPLDFVDAILGIKIEVPTVYGNVIVNIPSGTQPETTIRMKGCGVKDLKTQKPGDQYIKIKVQVPKHLTKKQRETLESYKAETLNKTSESKFDKLKKKFK